MKKIIAAIMTALMIIAMASNVIAAPSSFPDIRDDSLARDVAVLQMLGVIGGDENGNFNPGSTLTRAAFCKMAVIVMGNGDKEPLYRSRTIFSDVLAGHWARGYINLAATGETRIIAGTSQGFKPDADITYAQAITILMRILGYKDADAGMLWPDGYLALAEDVGLNDGLAVSSPGASITRTQAARLFRNLLGTPVKDGGSYISTLGTTTADVVIMELGVQAPDGTSGAVRTSAGIFKTVSGVVPPSILGLRGTILKNTAGKLLAFLPDEKKQLVVTVSQISAAWLKDVSGVRYDIPAKAPAYTATETKEYGSAFIDIAAGMQVTLFYSADGKVEAVYINTSKSDGAIVAGASIAASAFNTLTGGDTGYKIYKNGAPAALADIKQYDVITYDKSARILNVSDFRLTGSYENCWPNVASPSKVTVMGHEFNVLPSAIDSLANFKIGQVITFLFTSDLQVAGAASGGVSGQTAVGIVQPDITATSVTVKLLNGLTLSGNPRLPDSTAAQYAGELVTVYSSEPGNLSISKLVSSGASGDLDLVKLTLGTAALSPAVKIFERAGSGPVTQISVSDLTQTKISASKVIYAGVDYAGRVATLVLNDVTGDRYMYGFLKEDKTSESSWDGGVFYNRTIAIVNSGNKSGTTPIITGAAFTNDAPGGIAVSADGNSLVAVVTLMEVKNVKRSDFYVRNDKAYLLVDGQEYPVSQNVECYNKSGKTWFASLNDARAFSETLTVYYDRAAAEGGKIRMVVAG